LEFEGSQGTLRFELQPLLRVGNFAFRSGKPVVLASTIEIVDTGNFMGPSSFSRLEAAVALGQVADAVRGHRVSRRIRCSGKRSSGAREGEQSPP